MTGGEIVFGLGMYALMADITTEDNRTKRMPVLDAFKFVGIAIGFVSFERIKLSPLIVSAKHDNVEIYVKTLSDRILIPIFL